MALYFNKATELKAEAEALFEAQCIPSCLEKLYLATAAFVEEGQKEHAIACQKEVYKIAQESQEISPMEKLSISYGVADFLAQADHIAPAVLIAAKAYQEVKKNHKHNQELLYLHLSQFADILGMAAFSKEAEGLCKKAIDLASALFGENSIEEAECRLSRARTLYDLKRYEEALLELEKSYHITTNNDDASPVMTSDVLSSQAKVYQAMENEIASLSAIEKALSYLDDYEWDDDLRVGILLDAVDIYLSQQAYGKALATLDEVLSIEKRLRFDPIEIQQHEQLYDEIQALRGKV